MLERELKFWPVCRPTVHANLVAIGKLDFSTIMQSLYFDHPQRPPDSLFRLRSFCGETYLTAKSPRHEDDLKSRDEFESLVSSRDGAIHFLKAMGFVIHGGIEERWREQWVMPDGTVVVLERMAHPDVPDYVEIEGADSEAIFSCAKSLGLEQTRYAPITFDQLALLHGVSFEGLQRPMDASLAGDRIEHHRKTRAVVVRGSVLESLEVCHACRGSINIHEEGGKVQCGGLQFDVQKPLEICSFLRLAGLEIKKGGLTA